MGRRSVTTTYVLDTATPLTMVLAETNETTHVTTRYWHGLDTLAQSDGTTTQYFAYDGLGSVRQLVDATGSVGLAQTFDPYGNGYAKAGSASSSLGYSGEQTDSNGFVFLRARYYRPGMGRFTQMDPSRLEGNLYQYGLSNPVNKVDPSGYCAGDDEECREVAERIMNNYPNVEIKMGGSIKKWHWTAGELEYVEEALEMASNAFSDDVAFQHVFGDLTFLRRSRHNPVSTVYGQARFGTTNIFIYDAAFTVQDTPQTAEVESATMVVIHEMGHVLSETEYRKSVFAFPWWVYFVNTSGGCGSGTITTWGFTGGYLQGPNIYTPVFAGVDKPSPLEDFANAFLLWTLYKNHVFVNAAIRGGEVQELAVYDTYKLSIDYIEQTVEYYRNLP